MVLTKMINGECINCTTEEEKSIRAEWALNDSKRSEEINELASRKQLENKYPDPIKVIDMLCQRLGIDPTLGVQP